MEGESGVTGRIIDEIHSSDIPGDQMEGKIGVTRSIIDELHFWDIQGGQMEGETMVLLEVSFLKFILWISKEVKWKVKMLLCESGVTRSVIDECDSSDIQADQI